MPGVCIFPGRTATAPRCTRTAKRYRMSSSAGLSASPGEQIIRFGRPRNHRRDFDGKRDRNQRRSDPTGWLPGRGARVMRPLPYLSDSG